MKQEKSEMIDFLIEGEWLYVKDLMYSFYNEGISIAKYESDGVIRKEIEWRDLSASDIKEIVECVKFDIKIEPIRHLLEL